jgi:hypothetical protein
MRLKLLGSVQDQLGRKNLFVFGTNLTDPLRVTLGAVLMELGPAFWTRLLTLGTLEPEQVHGLGEQVPGLKVDLELLVFELPPLQGAFQRALKVH